MPVAPHFASASVERFPELAELFAVHGSRRISSVHLHHTFVPDHGTFQAVARELGSDEASGLELCRRMWRYHTQELGWADIAQHVTIDPAGRIWLNRSWDRPPASARGFNGSTRLGPFMIEMIGNFDRAAERPTELQWRAAVTVIAAIQKAFGLAPEAVAFHNEMTDQKSCPGSSIDKVAAIREIAAQHTASGGDGARPAKRSTSPLGTRQTAAFALLAGLLDRRDDGSLARGGTQEGEPGDELDESRIPVDAIARLTGRAAGPRGVGDGLGRGGGEGLELSGPMLRQLKPHVLNLRQGLFSTDGDFSTSREEAEALVHSHLDRWVAERLAAGEVARVMIHAHGGLNSEEDGLAYAYTMFRWWLQMGVYPIFFVWETGTIETFWQLLEDRLRRVERDLLDVLDDARDAMVERIVHRLGQDFWTTMKLAAERAAEAGASNGSHQLARMLGELSQKHAGKIELHGVGHSAGAIFHAYFMRECNENTRKLPIESLHFLAPACTVRLFEELVVPRVDGSQIKSFTQYMMDRRTERADPTVTGYGKSLLYLVSRGFERERGEPILGLEESIRTVPRLLRFLGLGAAGPDRASAIFSPSGDDLPEKARAASTSHGGFDDDPATMMSVALRILGLSSSNGLPPVPVVRSRTRAAGRLFAPLASRLPPDELGGLFVRPPAPAPAPLAAGNGAAPPLPAIVGRRHALCIGINTYPGDARLDGCVADARLWASTLARLGFTTDLLLDLDASHTALLERMRQAVTSLAPGDHLVIQYAGHGAYFPDESGDEEDSRDEALVPVDYQERNLFISDDELWDVLQGGPDGACVTVIMDCCHSMSNTRAAFRFGAAPGKVREIRPNPGQIRAHRARKARLRASGPKPIEAMRHVKFAACQDHEYALEVDGQGNFTRAAVGVLARLTRAMTNDQMRLEIEKAFRGDARQHPGLECRTADRENPFLGGPLR